MIRPAAAMALALAFHPLAAFGHDIPNERIDRSIQITVEPRLLKVDYEVSLSELTLTQDLRRLEAALPRGDRQGWFDLYARVAGPLNAKGLLVQVDQEPVVLEYRGRDLEVREHPRYVFHLTGVIPRAGRLALRDTNYASSEGTSRLALRATAGVEVAGYAGPADVDQVPIQPAWTLSDDDEKHTKEVAVVYQAMEGPIVGSARAAPASEAASGGAGLSGLLDRSSGGRWWMLWMVAMGLGGLHALQPGHGKTLAAACAIAPGARASDPVLLGVAAGLAHAGGVMMIALGLWITQSSAVGALHQGLAGFAGFVIAAVGLWRFGRVIGGHEVHAHPAPGGGRRAGSIGLGLAAGLTPCWDAVSLLVLEAAIGRLVEGVELVLAFCLGMTAALAASGWLVWRLGARAVERLGGRFTRVGAGLGGLVVAGFGLVLFLS